jgi:hypothetical protein
MTPLTGEVGGGFPPSSAWISVQLPVIGQFEVNIEGASGLSDGPRVTCSAGAAEGSATSARASAPATIAPNLLRFTHTSMSHRLIYRGSVGARIR